MAVQARGLAHALAEAGTPVTVVPTNVSLGPLAWIRGARGIVNLCIYLLRLLVALPRADVVHIMAASGLSFFLFTVPAVLLGRIAGRRVLVNYRGGLAESFLHRRGRWVLPVLKLCHRLIVPSGFLKEVFDRVGLRPEVVPNYIDLARFSSPSEPGDGAEQHGPRILVTRTLEPIYNIGAALDAFRRVSSRIPGAELIIAGDGSLRRSLEKRVKEENLSGVTFLGRVDATRIPELYSRADLALNPTNVDNMPISVLEAFAAGVPVVSTRAGGVSYLITHQVNGLLAEVGDARGLAACMLKVLRQPEMAKRLASAGRAFVESFSLEVVRVTWQSLYRQEARNRTGAGSPEDV